MDLSAHTRFPVALLRPLGHLSEVGKGIACRTAARIGDGRRTHRERRVLTTASQATPQDRSDTSPRWARINVAKAMRPGYRNVIKVYSFGRLGNRAMVLIAN